MHRRLAPVGLSRGPSVRRRVRLLDVAKDVPIADRAPVRDAGRDLMQGARLAFEREPQRRDEDAEAHRLARKHVWQEPERVNRADRLIDAIVRISFFFFDVRRFER